MKKMLNPSRFSLLAVLALSSSASADSLDSAKITQIVKEVTVYRGKASGKAATLGQQIDSSSSVTTGRRSRAELTFKDNTITRLGQNSIFSFRKGGRDVELKKGSILLQVPKNAGGATIRTATVTAAITGTTSMFEYNPGHWVKLITIEGTQEIRLKGQAKGVAVPAGHMIVMRPDAQRIPQPVPIDISKLLATSALVDSKHFEKLPGPALASIETTVRTQQQGKRTGAYLPTSNTLASPLPRKTTSSTNAAITRTLYEKPQSTVQSTQPRIPGKTQ